MELMTQRALECALCSTKPTWAFRTKDGAAILRVSARIESDVYGQLCVKIDGKKTVKSFTYYPKALPAEIPVGVVLKYFIEALREEARLDVEFVSWSEDVKLIKAEQNTHLLTVGSEVIAKQRITAEGAVIHSQPENDYFDVASALSNIALLENGQYTGPLPSKPRSAIKVKLIKLGIACDRPGVYLTETVGKIVAHSEKLDESLGSDVVIIEFPLETKILTVDFLMGLLLEVYCQCGSTAQFLNSYRLVGMKGLSNYLDEFVKAAIVIKQNRKRVC